MVYTRYNDTIDDRRSDHQSIWLYGTSNVTAPSKAEQELIMRSQQGDRRAYGELVTLYQNGVINVVYRMCGNPILAEDAGQEAFIRAWKNLRRFDGRHSFRSWIYRIAINAALDVLKREKETSELDALQLAAGNDLPEATLERKERADEVRQAILALPEVQRTVLILREYEGLSYAEISSALGIPLGTVMSRLSYARGQLRQSLLGYLEEV
jgi:RNA polymerase sigma-70 factor (ECF subfamily)